MMPLRMGLLTAGLVTLCLAVSLSFPLASHADPLVKIIDGDTIEADGKRMRIFGIDAPETHQNCQDKANLEYQCGLRSKDILRDIVGLKEYAGTVQSLDCTGIDKDRYGRWVSVCFINQTNVGREMVRRGAALAYRQYSLAYVEDENYAKNAQNGIWQGTFELPWVWRRIQKQPH